MKGAVLFHATCWWSAIRLSTGRILPILLLFLIFASTTKISRANLLSPPPAFRDTSSRDTGSVITIGVGAWLSNPSPGDWDWGWAEANSVQLAINQANAAGGIDVGGTIYTLDLVTADDGCTSGQGVTAANTLLDAGVVAVIAHSCSSSSLAAQALYNAAGVAMVSPSSTGPSVTQQGYDTTFRTISHDGSNPTLLATYFRSWLALSSSAIVSGTDNFWGDQIGDIYSHTFTALGGTITSRRTVAGLGEFNAALTAIKSENPDVIYFIDADPVRAGEFSLAAHSLGMANIIIGWSSGDKSDDSVLDDYVGTAGSAAAENDYVALQYRRYEDMPGWASFLSAYQAADFPHEPENPGYFGAFAYDAARMIVAAIDQAESTDPVDINNQIAAMQNYHGVVGTYQGFNACGDVIPQWAWLEAYQDGQWAFLVQSAPASICSSSEIFLPFVLRN